MSGTDAEYEAARAESEDIQRQLKPLWEKKLEALKMIAQLDEQMEPLQERQKHVGKVLDRDRNATWHERNPMPPSDGPAYIEPPMLSDKPFDYLIRRALGGEAPPAH